MSIIIIFLTCTLMAIAFVGIVKFLGNTVNKGIEYFKSEIAPEGVGVIEITSVTDKEPSQIMEEEPSVIVKEPYFNPNKIKEYITETEQKKFIYRPQTLNSYIGQDKAKALVRLNIKKIIRLKPVHFLISGSRGCGKTTLAYIIKNQLGVKMIERVAGEITNADQISDLINEINSCEDEHVILFIDEIHALKPQLCESFYPIMEDFKVAGKNVKPFIMIGATTQKNILMKKVAPLVDRFHVQVELEKYSVENIIQILNQYKAQLFPEENLAEGHYEIIAKNCKFTPRIAITLLEDSLIEPNIRHVLECHRIIKDGLTDLDIRILRILQENSRPIGEKALAKMIGISQADYSSLYESYLILQEFIITTSRGRILGKKGKKFLKGIKWKSN